MGNRAVVVFKDSGGYAPAVYLHWAGAEIAELLKEAAPVMRHADASYSAARFCGVCHSHSPNRNIGLGLIEAPKDMAEVQSEGYSHGDAGVFEVDCETACVNAYNGYGFRNDEKFLQLPRFPE